MDNYIFTACIYCGKPIERGEYFCSDKCKIKFNLITKTETSETDAIRCPHCLELQDEISKSDYDTEGNEPNDIIKCDHCDEEFVLSAHTFTTFTAYLTEKQLDEMANKEAK